MADVGIADRARRTIRRLIATLLPDRAAQEMSREVAAHLAMLEDEFRRRGQTPDDARAAARRTLGSTAYAADLHRDARSFAWLDDLGRDLRYALRAMRREPGFMLVVVLTLALGIGANTAIFSVVDGVLIRPLPYKDSSRLVRVWENVPGAEIGDGKGPDRRYGAMDVNDLLAATPRVRTITNLAAFSRLRLTTTIDGDATRMDGFRVSAGFFPLLGVAPIAGRTFTPEESAAGHERVLVLGYDAWQRFGGTSDVIGRAVVFTGDPTSPFGAGVGLDLPYLVVGVMPPGFKFPYDNAQFWVPRVLAPSTGRFPVRIETVARLADTVPAAMAAAELETIRRDAHGLAASERPPAGRSARYELIPLHDELTRPVRPALLVLTAAVGLVLLIACVNVANLLLARTASRRREMAVRAAIGAAPGRLVRQLLTESVLLAALGGVAGSAFAFAGVRLFRMLGTTLGRADLGAASVFPRLAEVSVDGVALGFALAVSIASGIVFGMAPALRHARPRQADILHDASAPSARTRLRNSLVIVEIAMATMLLVGAGLLINSFARLATVDPGFQPAHLVTFQIGQSTTQRQDEQRTFAERFVERLRAMPNVQAAAYARQLPLVQLQDVIRLTVRRGEIEEVLGEMPDVRFVSGDYMKTMGIPVVAGRGFSEADGAGQPGVVLINEALARRAFAGEDAVGQIVLFGAAGHRMPLEVVGIVGNVRQFGLDRAPDPQYFMDIRQVPTDPAFRAPPLFPVGVYYAVRTQADTAALVAGVRAIARDLDAQAAVTDIATMEQILSNSITRPRMYAVLVGVFAGVAWALAVIGLYGVMAYSVTQRTREIGVRVALGAERSDVMRLVLSRSLMLTVAGIAIGLAGAAGLTQYLESLLFGLRPLDPATFGAVACLFTVVAFTASYVPARRASRVDPLVALRHE